MAQNVDRPGLSMATEPSPVRPAVFVVAILLTILCGIWVRQAEIVVLTCQVTESVPAVPAVAMLILLLVVRPFLKFLRFGIKEILVVYAFMVIAISIPGCGIVRFLLALLPAPTYFASPGNGFALTHPHLKPWFAPTDADVVRQLYEGSPHGKVPWREWMLPLFVWILFFLIFWLTLCCLIALFHRQWTDRERLSFPLLFLPMEMTGVGEAGKGSLSLFFRNPVMWIGFGLASFYNLMNMLHAFNPAVICPGNYFDAGALFTEYPFDAMQPLQMHFRPELIGFGFLVSTEVSLSIWIAYLFEKGLAIAGRTIGYQMNGYPFAQEQSIGAYICLAGVLVWAARRDLVSTMGLRALDSTDSNASDKRALSSRLTVVGLITGTSLLCLFCHLAGMALWAALVYFVIVLSVALVYARIRAETGVPLIWMFPYYMQKKVMLYTLGYAPFVGGGNLGTLTIFALLTFLSRGYFPSLAAYQLENCRLAEVAGIRRLHMSLTTLLAILVGLAVGFYIHLTPYYYFGAGTLREGIWGTGLAIQEFEDIVGFSRAPKPPDIARIAATGFGFVAAGGLTMLRMTFLRFPLHPLGFGMATAYGDLIWWSAFVVWAIKTTVLKFGGVNVYKKLVPAFLGFALGHFFTGGVVWGLFSITGWATEEVLRRYEVAFG